MPSNQHETPSADALDAAVDRQYNELRDMIGCGDSYTDQRVVEATITDLVTAVEARAVARAERVCEWRYVEEDIGLWGGACGTEWQFLADGPADNKMNHCPHCGGRVRVVEAE
jgi:hypothetical protein